MKVVMVGPYPEPGTQLNGGVERVIDTLLPALACHVELTLVVPGASRDFESVNHGVRTIYLKRVPGPGALTYWTTEARGIARTVDQLMPDVVHLQGLSGAGQFVRSPRILTVHGIVDRDLVATDRGKRWGPVIICAVARVVRAVEGQSRRRIGNVIVINPYVLEALPDVERLSTFAIPNPVDPVFFQSTTENIIERSREIVSVGHIGPRKNTYELLCVTSNLMRQDAAATLTVCGKASDDSYEQKCRSLIRAEGLEDRITLAGNLTGAELVKILDGASCLLMTSRQETAPMAIAEAHARGVAVVAPEAFGIKHMITPGRNGFFLPANDLDAQAEVLRAALDHDWDRKSIMQDAWGTYDSHHIAHQTIAAYRGVLAKASLK